MHYYQFNIKEYRKDTGHLTLLEHAIYRSLIDTYYLNEAPLSADNAKLMRTHSIRTEDEQKAFKMVLEDFFTLEDDGYHHKKCDEELNKIYDKSAKARESAKKRWEANAKRMRTHSEGNATQNPKPINPLPNNPSNNITSDDVTIVFEYWRCLMNKTSTAKLTAKRKACIKARFNEGYTYDQITSAIKGCASSAFHMGQNDAGKQHNDLTLILRSGDKLEQFMEYLNKPKQPNGKPNGKQSLAERTELQTRQILSNRAAREASVGYVGQDGPAIRPQVGFQGGRETDRGRTFDGELFTVVPEDEGPH